MQQLIRQKVMGAALSDKEIMELVEGQANLVIHDEIAKYRDINHLLGKHGACIILYAIKILPDQSVFGHWCGVFRAGWDKSGKTISFFDPYGNEPDYTMQFMTPQAIEEYGNEPLLSHLLQDFARKGGLVVYNIAPLQNHQKGNAICGRLTGLRIQFKHLNGNEFAKLMNSWKGVSPDELATLMTSFIN